MYKRNFNADDFETHKLEITLVHNKGKWDYKSLPFESIQYWTEEGKASSTEVAYAYGTPERIDEATKGEIDDRHYSEKGHLSIGKRLAVILSSQNGGEYFTKKSLF